MEDCHRRKSKRETQPPKYPISLPENRQIFSYVDQRLPSPAHIEVKMWAMLYKCNGQIIVSSSVALQHQNRSDVNRLIVDCLYSIPFKKELRRRPVFVGRKSGDTCLPSPSINHPCS